MTDTMTSQNIDLSSLDILYMYSTYHYGETASLHIHSIHIDLWSDELKLQSLRNWLLYEISRLWNRISKVWK